MNIKPSELLMPWDEYCILMLTGCSGGFDRVVQTLHFLFLIKGGPGVGIHWKQSLFLNWNTDPSALAMSTYSQ